MTQFYSRENIPKASIPSDFLLCFPTSSSPPHPKIKGKHKIRKRKRREQRKMCKNKILEIKILQKKKKDNKEKERENKLTARNLVIHAI